MEVVLGEKLVKFPFAGDTSGTPESASKTLDLRLGDGALTQNGALVEHQQRPLLFAIEYQFVRLAVTRLLDGHRQRVQVGRKPDLLRIRGPAVDLVGYFQSMVVHPASRRRGARRNLGALVWIIFPVEFHLSGGMFRRKQECEAVPLVRLNLKFVD